jgi:hypothetical protein
VIFVRCPDQDAPVRPSQGLASERRTVAPRLPPPPPSLTTSLRFHPLPPCRGKGSGGFLPDFLSESGISKQQDALSQGDVLPNLGVRGDGRLPLRTARMPRRGLRNNS